MDELVGELLDRWLPGPSRDNSWDVPHQVVRVHRGAQRRQLGRIVAGEHFPRGVAFGAWFPGGLLKPRPGDGYRLGHDDMFFRSATFIRPA